MFGLFSKKKTVRKKRKKTSAISKATKAYKCSTAGKQMHAKKKKTRSKAGKKLRTC